MQAVSDYKQVGDRILNTPITQATNTPSPAKEAQLNLLNSTLDELANLIEQIE